MSTEGQPEKVVPFNPIAELGLTYDWIVGKIADALALQSLYRLPDLPNFTGAGIYCLYYTGEFQPFGPYEPLTEDPTARPIYIGKADPPGSRKGEYEFDPGNTKLRDRIRQHRSSITQADNLDPQDFLVRFLVLDEVWIPLAERLMIRQHRPLWVTYIDGFGNHAPGEGRKDSVLSMWDTIHPGRGFTKKQNYRINPLMPDEIKTRIQAVLHGQVVPVLPEDRIEAELSSDENP